MNLIYNQSCQAVIFKVRWLSEGVSILLFIFFSKMQCNIYINIIGSTQWLIISVPVMPDASTPLKIDLLLQKSVKLQTNKIFYLLENPIWLMHWKTLICSKHKANDYIYQAIKGPNNVNIYLLFWIIPRITVFITFPMVKYIVLSLIFI